MVLNITPKHMNRDRAWHRAAADSPNHPFTDSPLPCDRAWQPDIHIDLGITRCVDAMRPKRNGCPSAI